MILTAENANSNHSCDTPTLGNPALDLNRTRTIVAGQCSFRRNYNKNYIKKWSEAERAVVVKITGTSMYPWRPNIPCLSNATDNSCQPKCMVGGKGYFVVIASIFQNLEREETAAAFCDVFELLFVKSY